MQVTSVGEGMTCQECSSIFLRPAEPAWSSEGVSQWARRFQCGGCGAIYVIRMTRIGKGETDGEKHRVAHSAPAPKGLGENGGTAQ